MRKGLTTLMTVAIALVSVQALAYAPVIGQIPSPIVGNRSGAPTQAQAYVYPDAFDLNALATDDNTASDQLLWSYEIAVPPFQYAINGNASINSGSENVVNPPVPKRISGPLAVMNGITGPPAADDPNPDTLINTITIRNIALYPYGGVPNTSQSGPAWTMQPVTFWCSDGNLASSSTVMFYTDNTYTGGVASGINRLSNVNPWTKIVEDKLAIGANWSMYDPFYDHTTSNTWTDGRGICLTVTQTGNNWGSVATPMGFVTLTDNMVYRIRLQMNCNQLTPGKTPFWDFILENWNGDALRGQNLYGVDTYFIDNEGGNNAIINKLLGTEVTMIWAPAAFQTPQWRSTVNGIFANNTPSPPGINYSQSKDAALRFRVLDLDARADLQNNQKYGSICMQNVIVETCPLSRRIYETTGTATPPTPDLYGALAGTLRAAHNNPVPPAIRGNMLASALLGSTISYTGGILSLTPSATGQDIEIVTVTPATDLLYVNGQWATIADDWPIPWETGKIYELKVDMSAPDTTAAAHPWDVLWLNMEPPTNELIQESYITANHGLATPKPLSGTPLAPQTYYLFYHSGTETKSAVPAFHFLRWRIRWGNNPNTNWPNPSDIHNTGMVRIHSVKVNKVQFK